MTSLKNCVFESLPVASLTLDYENPRIAQWISIYGGEPTAEQVALALGAGSSDEESAGTTFRSLKESIRTNEGIIHPIIVNRDLQGRLVVIEGNTRTRIYTEFAEAGVKGNWATIPALVYSNLSQEHIDAIRLQAHLVGVRQWDPYSKARYLASLQERQHLTLAQIVDYCGGDKREVMNYINAYTDMHTHYLPILDNDQDFDPSRFTAFVELQSQRVLSALHISGYDKSDFSRWVHEHKLFPLHTVRKLPWILKDKKSTQVFLAEGAQAAIRVLESEPAQKGLTDCELKELAQEICRRIGEFKYQDLQRLKADPESETTLLLCEARDALVEFCEDIRGED